MSGYRQHGFDPDAYETLGKPLKPYNMVQWTGVAIGLAGAALITLDVLARLGWTPRFIGDLGPGPFVLMVVGLALLNSRREPGTLVDEDQRARNKRTLVITAAICAAVLGAAALIEFQGA